MFEDEKRARGYFFCHVSDKGKVSLLTNLWTHFNFFPSGWARLQKNLGASLGRPSPWSPWPPVWALPWGGSPPGLHGRRLGRFPVPPLLHLAIVFTACSRLKILTATSSVRANRLVSRCPAEVCLVRCSKYSLSPNPTGPAATKNIHPARFVSIWL